MAPASRWLLALGIAGSALAVGTVHTITLCIVTVVLAAAVTAYTALQWVPMPIGRLAVIAPYNADVWSRALAPLHEAGVDGQSVGRHALGGASWRYGFVSLPALV
jgi:hypothetical protein